MARNRSAAQQVTGISLAHATDGTTLHTRSRHAAAATTGITLALEGTNQGDFIEKRASHFNQPQLALYHACRQQKTCEQPVKTRSFLSFKRVPHTSPCSLSGTKNADALPFSPAIAAPCKLTAANPMIFLYGLTTSLSLNVTC